MALYPGCDDPEPAIDPKAAVDPPPAFGFAVFVIDRAGEPRARRGSDAGCDLAKA
jgi:hypothetical protein